MKSIDCDLDDQTVLIPTTELALNSMAFRCVTQRCESARLLIDNDEEYIHIGRGFSMRFIQELDVAVLLIFYVSWAKGSNAGDLPKIVKSLLNMRLLSSSSSKYQSICEACIESNEMHLLVIPQAALTSKLQRGKNIQYHGQLTKEDGAEDIYNEFIRLLHVASKETLESMGATGTSVVDMQLASKIYNRRAHYQAGTFGNRQALHFESEGPFTHMFEM